MLGVALQVSIFRPGSSWIDIVAAYLVLPETAMAGFTIVIVLWRARSNVASWILAACSLVGLSLIASAVGSSLHYLPPVDFAGPITSHTSNSFPSHHALLAAAVVALVYLACKRWALPFVVVSILIDWALVSGHHHHLIDVVASDVIVAASTLIALGIRKTTPWQSQSTKRRVLPHK